MNHIIPAALMSLLPSILLASTPQINDDLVYDGKTINIFQTPMRSFWEMENDAGVKRKPRRPKFTATSSANWKGYIAKWEIRKAKLWLLSIEGQVRGKEVKNEQILVGKKFPCEASWFSGRVYLPAGEYDEETGEYETVIEFEIDKGHIKNTRNLKSYRIPYAWDGMDEK